MAFADILGHAIPIAWLRQALRTGRLAHAYLFVGEEAIGKRSTALQCIQALNCETPPRGNEPDACGHCRACHQIATAIHPDVLFIQPDTGQGQHPQIKIEQIRDVEQHVMYRPLISERKICLIDDADRLNVNAANALLKTLEEPPDHCLFLLITSRPLALLSTVKSRCLTVRFTPPAHEHVVAHIRSQRGLSDEDARFACHLTNGRVGAALSVDLEAAKTREQEVTELLCGNHTSTMTDRMTHAESLSKSGNVPETLTWMWSLLRDLLLITTASPRERLFHPTQYARLAAAAKQLSPATVLGLLDELHTLEQSLPRNLNMHVGMERFFMHLHDALTARAR